MPNIIARLLGEDRDRCKAEELIDISAEESLSVTDVLINTSSQELQVTYTNEKDKQAIKDALTDLGYSPR